MFSIISGELQVSILLILKLVMFSFSHATINNVIFISLRYYHFPINALGQVVMDSIFKSMSWLCFLSIQNYTYAGVQSAGECYCGNEGYDKYEEAGAKCTDPCKGRKSQMCGGDKANGVFELGKLWFISNRFSSDFLCATLNFIISFSINALLKFL